MSDTECKDTQHCPQAERIGKTEGRVDTIEKDLMAIVMGLRKDYRQIVIALIALIAAILGVRMVGSPPWDDLRAFVSAFAGIFVLAFCVLEWRELKWWKRVMMPLFGLFVMVSTYSRIFIFHQGLEPAPWWYGNMVDFFLIAISVTLVAAVWKYRWR